MFRPEKMSLLQCVVMDQDLLAACNFLVHSKALHLLDKSLTHVVTEGREGTGVDYLAIKATMESTRLSMEQVRDWLGLDKDAYIEPYEGAIDPKDAEIEISEKNATLVKEIGLLEYEKEKLAAREAELKRISDTLQSLEHAGVSASELKALRHFASVTGVMPARFLPDLKKALKLLPFHLESRLLGPDEVSIVALTPKENYETLRNTLKSVFFSEVQIPDVYSADSQNAMDDIELELWSIREEEADLKLRENRLRKRARESYAEWYGKLLAHLRVLNAMQLFGKTDNTTLISGWLPRKDAKRIVAELSSLLDERLICDLSNPEDPEGEASSLVKSGKAAVPTKFNHPSFLRPFESLVTTYGYPEYDGIDPTLFVAITFLVLFGMMFGDVGQGFVFVLLGAFLGYSKKLRLLNDTGRLMLCVGASSMIFGFLYGSVFGCEELIPALWLHPAEDSIKLIGSAIFLGTLILTLGIGLNIAQAVIRHNWREALFGQWGILSGVFYWTAIALFYLMAVRKGQLTPLVCVAALVVPVALVLVGDLAWGAIKKRKEIAAAIRECREAETEEEEGIAEQLFKPVEIVLSLMTNTISFMRVGAFGMNHAVMMSVVFILAGVGGGISGPSATGASKVSWIMSVVAGNLFVMLLEGMIVFIQCLRLEYYEFFSKFFGGAGIKYDPLRVDDLQ